MNIYWLNPPLSTRVLYTDLAWMNFSSYMPEYNWIEPIINWLNYKDIDDVVNDIISKNTDVLCISTYFWNYMLCEKVIEKVKTINPKIIIIQGGPQGNENNIHPAVDYMCYSTGHGELFLIQALKQIKKYGKIKTPDFVPFLMTPHYKSNITKAKYDYPEFSSFEHNISYLLNVKKESEIIKKDIVVLYETTRGCPYSCVYCEWGGGIGTKISVKPLDIIKKDFDLLAMFKFSDIELVDANFGILDRDIEIVNYIAELKDKIGYPKEIMMYGLAKVKISKKEKILDALFTGNLIESHYFAPVQSIDQSVLDNIKRTDVSVEENMQLLEKYKKLYNSSGKVEMIMGLPGTTLDIFYEEMNLFQRAENWFIPRNIFCLLPNTEASSKQYREKHKIETAMAGTMENEESDVTIVSESVITKYRSDIEFVIETYSYSKDDWRQMFIMNRAMKEFGPRLKGKASEDLPKLWEQLKNKSWFKEIDDWSLKLTNGELIGKEIILIGDKVIEDIIKEHIDEFNFMVS